MELNEAQRAFKQAFKVISLMGDGEIPLSEVEHKAKKLNGQLTKELSEGELRQVIASLTEELNVTLAPGGTVVDADTFEPWLQERRSAVATPRSDAYEKLLASRDWEERVIRSLGSQTDEVVELLGDPEKPGPWARKGLLMGEVQSGKTANYIGVLNKALDYGYKVVIVIGGHTEELRRQTQRRFDSDLLGFDSQFVSENISVASRPIIGIGEIDSRLRATPMTTVSYDFNLQKKRGGVVWIDAEIPTVFVIKKNAGIIKNVANYIRQQASGPLLELPLVVIDDEADWGTPSTARPDTDPTRVNKEIRGLLATSTRSTYIGITATPFANVFIDDQAADEVAGNDLFPSDYIRVMATPSTYCGISQYFSPHHGGIRVDVEDCIELIPIVHGSSHRVKELPHSLRTAVICFLIGVAVRRIRARKPVPSSMLVNVSRFIDVQGQVFDLIQSHLEAVTNVIRSEFALASTARSSGNRAIEDVWQAEFRHIDGINWFDVQAELLNCFEEFKVELVNGKTNEERNRRRNLMTMTERALADIAPTIFVGGDVLSRGLTLDGLQVSYFVREPRTMDTLTQMGRWFGYRPGYSDLVRIWIPTNTAEDFAWSANVTEELREMLVEMRSRGLTPKNFGLRVRTHPEGFRIVAANKSRSTGQIYEGPIVWENRLIENYKVRADDAGRKICRNALDTLVDNLYSLTDTQDVSRIDSIGQYPTWVGVPIDYIHRFFAEFSAPTQSELFGQGTGGTPSMVYQALSEAKGSEYWDVTFVNGGGPPKVLRHGLEVNVSLRTPETFDSRLQLVEFKNRRIATSVNLVNSLNQHQKDRFDSVSHDDHAHLSGQKRVLSLIARPKLLLYVIETGLFPIECRHSNATFRATADDPLVTPIVAFPKLDVAEAIAAANKAKKFTGNSVYLRILYDPPDGDDDIDETDDE